jgi:hypothetical protein
VEPCDLSHLKADANPSISRGDARDARLAFPKEISMKKFLLALLAIAALSGSVFAVQSVAAPSPAAAYEPPDPC